MARTVAIGTTDTLQGLQRCCVIGIVLQHDMQLCQHQCTIMIDAALRVEQQQAIAAIYAT